MSQIRRMVRNCEFCVKSRAVVFCKADTIRLCLSCDALVHSANVLSRRHRRSLLCEGCGFEPTAIQCLDHKLFVCSGCDQNLHGALLQHRKQAMNDYIGCPSARDFAALWGYDLNHHGDDKELGANVSDPGKNWVATASSLDSMSWAGGVSAGGEFHPWMEAPTSALELNSSNPILAVEDPSSSSNLQNTALKGSQRQQQNCSILQQLLELERLQITENNNNSSLIPGQLPTEVYSNESQTSRKLAQDLDNHCQHPQLLDINLQQVDTIHQEKHAQPFSSLISQSEQLNSSSNFGISLEGDSFWQSKSPNQNSQLWSQNIQDLGICEDIDCCEDFSIPDVGFTFQNFEEFFGGGQDQVVSMLNDIQVACSSMENDVSIGESDFGYPRAIEGWLFDEYRCVCLIEDITDLLQEIPDS